MLKCVRLRLLRAECFGPWDLSRTRPEWEVSQVLKFLASPKILALEDQEQEARTLDFCTVKRQKVRRLLHVTFLTIHSKNLQGYILQIPGIIP